MTLTPEFSEAMVLAAELHRNQTRKGTAGTPYVAHLLAVTALVLEHGGSQTEAIAALLHDAVEDQGGQPTLQLIRERFGEAVAEIVEGCSDTDQMPKPPWRERKVAYLAHLRVAPAPVLMVAAADKLANARSMLQDYRECQEKLWERFHCTREENLWYYRAVVEVLSERAPRGLVAELDRVVGELEACSRVSFLSSR